MLELKPVSKLRNISRTSHTIAHTPRGTQSVLFFLQLHLFAKRNRKHRKIEILDQGHHSVHRVKHATCVKRQSVREGQSERERGRLRNAKLVCPFGGVVGCLARPRPVCRTHAVLTGPKGSTLSMRFINCAVNQFGHLTICIRKLQDKTLSST